MSQRLKVRVTVNNDGKTVNRELMLDEMKVADLSYVELLEFAMQAISSLRWEGKLCRALQALTFHNRDGLVLRALDPIERTS